MNRLEIISKKILSDVHFSTQQEFEEYLKNHPGYRENTRFFVNGVQVKAPPKQKKKPSTSQRSTGELFKQYSEIRGYSLENVFDKLFKNAESQGKDLKSFSDENKKIMLDFINNQIKKSGYKKGLSEKEFQSIFDHLLSKRNEEEKKKEEDDEPIVLRPPKKNNEEKKEEILEQHVSNFRQSSRREHFEKLNEDLRKNGIEELDEDGYREFLRDKVFNFKPSYDRHEQEKYARKHFTDGFYFPSISVEDVNLINETLTEIAIDYPGMDVRYDLVRENVLPSDCDAWHSESGYKHFKDYITTALEFNKNSLYFSPFFKPYKYNINRQNYLRSIGYNCRYNVSEGGEDRDECIKRLVTHEVAHKLWKQKVREERGETKEKGTIQNSMTTNFERSWNNLRNKLKRTGGIFQISGYAEKNVHEFFAECFAMYRFEKENLPPEVLKKMEEFIKWCSAMK